MSNSVIPVSDEQAKAIQEALKTLQGFGGFLQSTFGTMPEDIVGLLGGDYLKVRRAENVARMVEKARRRLEERKVEHADAPPSLAIPIMIAAGDESRDELQDLWAALLAAAADPQRNPAFRIKFIEVVKQMDPLDSKVLSMLNLPTRNAVAPDKLLRDASAFDINSDQVDISLENLKKLGLAGTSAVNAHHFISPLGRELMRAVQ